MVLEHVAQLARCVERVVFDDDRADAEHRIERDDVLGAVGEEDADAVTRLDSQAAEALCCAFDLFAQLAVGRLLAEELHGGGVARLPDGSFAHFDEGSRRHLDLCRDVCLVVLHPRMLVGHELQPSS